MPAWVYTLFLQVCYCTLSKKGEGHSTSDTQKKLVEAERTSAEKVSVFVMKPGFTHDSHSFFHCNLWV